MKCEALLASDREADQRSVDLDVREDALDRAERFAWVGEFLRAMVERCEDVGVGRQLAEAAALAALNRQLADEPNE
jgi:hypothetical protein